MQKSLQTNDRIKSNQHHLQTEEMIADIRSVLTPSQRVDAKLAACSGGQNSRNLQNVQARFARRPK